MEPELKGKKIVMGVTGGIACYKALDIIGLLKKDGAEVHVIMTDHSKNLVDTVDFERASGNEVHASLFHPKINYKEYLKKNKPIKHISLADVADLFLICPATANIIGKIANGIADDLLTTSVMATEAPVLICPAMNVKMWKNPITQDNISRLRGLGYHFADPEYGELACGYKGIGRLAKPLGIIGIIKLITKSRSSLKGKRVLVTAGATYEEIDPVRVITNKSSGKMGTALAEMAHLKGADVVLLRGSNSIEPRYNFQSEIFTTADDLFSRLKKFIKNAEIVIHCAAVSDFRVEKSGGKIKSDKKIMLELKPSIKILGKLRGLNKKMTLVGFKAEHNVPENELIKRAFDSLKKSNSDFVVANDVSGMNSGFDSDYNEVIVIDRHKKTTKIKLGSKKEIADKILELVA